MMDGDFMNQALYQKVFSFFVICFHFQRIKDLREGFKDKANKKLEMQQLEKKTKKYDVNSFNLFIINLFSNIYL